jgi:REP element-mobilizing transposase RayT
MLPEKCRKCARNKNPKVHTDCRICADTEFDETILCELNRSVQEENEEFECHAFLPTLKVIGSKKEPPSNSRKPVKGNVLAEQLAIIKLMNSDKIQYQKAWALQQLEKDPDAIIVDLKFHYAWNVKGGRCLFTKSEEYFSQIYDAFSKASIPSVLRTQLLWLAPDHVHVYCEADGKRSVEDILVYIKKYLEQNLVKLCPKVLEDLGPGESLWDDGYYVESIG